MAGKIDKAREAVVEFLNSANPDDEFFLVNFNRTPELAVAFTNNPGKIQMRLIDACSMGRTALLDINLSVHYMKGARNPRKALLVIGSGAGSQPAAASKAALLALSILQ